MGFRTVAVLLPVGNGVSLGERKPCMASFPSTVATVVTSPPSRH